MKTIKKYIEDNGKVVEFVIAAAQILFIAWSGYVLATTVTYRAGWEDAIASNFLCAPQWRP